MLAAFASSPCLADCAEVFRSANAIPIERRAAEARPALRAALAACHDEPMTRARILAELGWLALEGGRNDESAGYFREAVAAFDKLELTHAPELGNVADALAEVLWQRSHHRDEAETLFRRALAIAEASLAAEEPSRRMRWAAARELVDIRAARFARFLLDHERHADAARVLARIDSEAAALERGHRDTGLGELLLTTGAACDALLVYRRAADSYARADYDEERFSDRRWLQAWLEKAPWHFVAQGRAAEMRDLLVVLIRARAVTSPSDPIAAIARTTRDTLPPRETWATRCGP
jgi:tetratricopeptide (TPR) repeat protein